MNPDEELQHLIHASLKAKEYGPRVGKAYARAKLDGGYSAHEALKREIKRAEEENQFLMNAALEVLNR